MHVKVQDEVLVLAGKDAGKRGRVLVVDRDKGRAIVEQVNIMRKHTRANPQKGVKGGILEKEAPVALSNLMVVCGKCEKPTRARSQQTADGRRVRTCRHEGCGAQLGKKG